MTAPAAFPFRPMQRGAFPNTPTPLLPVRLTRSGVSVDVVGLVDSGAIISVLPFSIGSQFGIDWHSLTQSTIVGGVAAGVPAKILTAQGVVAGHPPALLLFAWAASDDVPLLFGYANFFLEFDVCFHATRGEFTVSPRTP
jgi:hypothetical protein